MRGRLDRRSTSARATYIYYRTGTWRMPWTSGTLLMKVRLRPAKLSNSTKNRTQSATLLVQSKPWSYRSKAMTVLGLYLMPATSSRCPNSNSKRVFVMLRLILPKPTHVTWLIRSSSLLNLPPPKMANSRLSLTKMRHIAPSTLLWDKKPGVPPMRHC